MCRLRRVFVAMRRFGRERNKLRDSLEFQRGGFLSSRSPDTSPAPTLLE